MSDQQRVSEQDTGAVRPNAIQRLVSHAQSKTLYGLMQLLPIFITLAVVMFVINYADGAVEPVIDTFVEPTVRQFIDSDDWHFPDVPGLSLFMAAVFFYFVGLFASTRVGKRAITWIKQMLGRVPVVKTILGVTQQGTVALTSQYNFSRVVFLEWPRTGMVAMGFVTAQIQRADQPETLVMVYIPTIPNPTSGNMAIVPEDDLFETDLSVEDAMKLVFSGGIVPPDSLSLARMPRPPAEMADLFLGKFETNR